MSPSGGTGDFTYAWEKIDITDNSVITVYENNDSSLNNIGAGFYRRSL